MRVAKHNWVSLFLVLMLSALASCGGGGGGGGAGVALDQAGAVDNKVSASPALGCFEDGTEVKAYDLAGNLLVSGLVSSCQVSVNLGAHTGPFILKTMPGKKYFDEKTGALSAAPYSGSGLLSVVPSVTAGKNYALNLITHLVAAQVGIDPASPGLPGVADPVAAIASAKTDVLSVLGLSEAELGGDLFASPTVLNGTNALSGSISGANLYAALLADLAASATGTPGEQADELFALVKQAKSSTGSSKASSLVSLSNTLVGSISRIASGSSPIYTQTYLGKGSTKPTNLDVAAAKTTAESAIKTTANVEKVSLVAGNQPQATTVVTSAGIVVVPDLGQFSAKALVEAYNAETGVLIPGASALTDGNGVAAIELGGYSGSIVLKVTGASGVSFYDEGLAKDEPFSSSDVLLGLIPASSIKNQTYFSVNPLTHIASAFAGVTPSSPKVVTANGAKVDQVVYESLARLRLMLGLSYATIGDLEARVILNPLTATSPLSSAKVAAGVNTSLSGGYWSLYFAELARASTAATHLLRPTLWEMTKATHAEILSKNASYASLSDSDNVVVLKKALVAVGDDDSSFLSKCTRLSSSLSTDINTRFKNASSRMKFNIATGATELEQMVEELRFSIGLIQNKGQTPASFASRTLATCPK